MPIYTYRCENCGVQFEKTQKFTDQSLTRCPECGKKSLHKVYTPVGVVFKGSGFYATDNRSPSGMGLSNRSDEKEKTAESTSTANEKSKSETKTAPPEKTTAPASAPAAAAPAPGPSSTSSTSNKE